ncbi:hypothetical protein ACFOG5_09665 [Pedobacter fastidiosus]|uniref:Uncharacterized protein n=2 Tax=Pedobacter fastidiosus TaxID=2765361 RepID=A0ABR7KSU9_9SPHI|nr:hypothetical protein [Pedobacter fastidiosus]
MQSKKQCPNCKSYYTKSDSQKSRKMMMFIMAVWTLICVSVLMKYFDGFVAFIGISTGIATLYYAFKYFFIKVQYGHCKTCNHKWSYA